MTVLYLLISLLAVASCSGGGERERGNAVPLDQLATIAIPDEQLLGEQLFNASCASCHGARALGTQQGPALVHKIYEPTHHANLAFERAVQFGVQAHHWRFGNMPPVPGVTREQVRLITDYVRWLQRQAGIY